MFDHELSNDLLNVEYACVEIEIREQNAAKEVACERSRGCGL